MPSKVPDPLEAAASGVHRTSDADRAASASRRDGDPAPSPDRPTRLQEAGYPRAEAQGSDGRIGDGRFPDILHEVVSNPSHEHIISWLPHGKGFVIHNKKLFEETILPAYFDGAKYTSFARRLRRWDFWRVPIGTELGAYYNKYFVRDRPDWATKMKYPGEEKERRDAERKVGGGSTRNGNAQAKSGVPRAGHNQHPQQLGAAISQQALRDKLTATTYGSSDRPTRLQEAGGRLEAQGSDGRIGDGRFPDILHEVVSNPSHEHIISWLPHGKGFVIHNKKLFEETILPAFFDGAQQFTSFTRLLRRWRFRVPSGPELGAYCHPDFVRDHPDWAAKMEYPGEEKERRDAERKVGGRLTRNGDAQAKSGVPRAGHNQHPQLEAAGLGRGDGLASYPRAINTETLALGTDLAVGGRGSMPLPLPTLRGRCRVSFRSASVGGPVLLERAEAATTANSWRKTLAPSASVALPTGSFQTNSAALYPNERSFIYGSRMREAPQSKVPKSPSPSVESGASSRDNELAGMVAPSRSEPVTNFLFQLTRMLTDNNRRYIEWKKGSIVIHDPLVLERELLGRYFGTTNYSTFQRQMRYYGFRKVAGPSKMARPAQWRHSTSEHYVHDAAKDDIASLLSIRRKTKSASGCAARSFSRYHLFLRLERHLLLHQRGAASKKEGTPPSEDEAEKYKDLNLPPLPSRYEGVKIPKLWFLSKGSGKKITHRKSHGVAPFADISRIVASNWKSIDAETMAFVTLVSDMLKVRAEELADSVSRPERSRPTKRKLTDEASAKEKSLDAPRKKAFFAKVTEKLASRMTKVQGGSEGVSPWPTLAKLDPPTAPVPRTPAYASLPIMASYERSSGTDEASSDTHTARRGSTIPFTKLPRTVTQEPDQLPECLTKGADTLNPTSAFDEDEGLRDSRADRGNGSADKMALSRERSGAHVRKSRQRKRERGAAKTEATTRERNRVNARETRKRKKECLQQLKSRVDELKLEQIRLKQAINKNIREGDSSAEGSEPVTLDPEVKVLLKRSSEDIPDWNGEWNRVHEKMPTLILPGRDQCSYKERNRIHAKRTRDRKRIFMKEIEAMIKQLEDENTLLKDLSSTLNAHQKEHTAKETLACLEREEAACSLADKAQKEGKGRGTTVASKPGPTKPSDALFIVDFDAVASAVRAANAATEGLAKASTGSGAAARCYGDRKLRRVQTAHEKHESARERQKETDRAVRREKDGVLPAPARARDENQARIVHESRTETDSALHRIRMWREAKNELEQARADLENEADEEVRAQLAEKIEGLERRKAHWAKLLGQKKASLGSVG